MKYLRTMKRKDGSVVHRFMPPSDVVKAGVVRPRVFEDGRTARYEMPRLLERIEAYRRGDIVAGDIGPESKVKQVVGHYLTSKKFMSLSPATRKQYERRLKELSGTPLGDLPINKVDLRVCKEAYEGWLKKHTLKQAIIKAGIFGSFLKYAGTLDLIKDNPMNRVNKPSRTSNARVWTRAQVELFVDTAFTKFEWRNTGLLVLMCYEWAQRPGVIAKLEWSSLDLDAGRVKLYPLQRKRPVELPIGEPLLTLLREQKKDWDFQKLVVPIYRKRDNAYLPLKGNLASAIIASIKEESGLPRELHVYGLRKTAIMEMIEAGVDGLKLIQVTGHSDTSGLSNYHSNTYENAKTALEQRKKT